MALPEGEPGGRAMREYQLLARDSDIHQLLSAPYLILDGFVEALMPVLKSQPDGPTTKEGAEVASWLN